MTKQKKNLNVLSVNQKNKEASLKLKKSKKYMKPGKSSSKVSVEEVLNIINKSYKSDSEPEENDDEVMEIVENERLKSDEADSESVDEDINENEDENGSEIKGTNADKNHSNKKQGVRKSKHSLFIGNLVQGVTDSALQELVQSVLSPQDIKVCEIKRKKNGYSKGYAYLEVSNNEAFNAALKLNGLKLKDRQVLVARNDKHLDRIMVDVKNTLFINKIKAELNDGQIIQFLEKFIPVDEIVRFDRIKTDKGIPTGSLILEVASEVAFEQIKMLDGEALAGKAISVKIFQTSLTKPNFMIKPFQHEKKVQEKKKGQQRVDK